MGGGWGVRRCYMRGWATRNFTQFQPNAENQDRRYEKVSLLFLRLFFFFFNLILTRIT